MYARKKPRPPTGNCRQPARHRKYAPIRIFAAARGLCGHEAGIACILGTGSNSCFYNGEEIISNISPLGFILGDEGSGAVLGKLGRRCITEKPASVNHKRGFFKAIRPDSPEIIDRLTVSLSRTVFWQASPFLAQHLDEPAIRTLCAQ